MVDNSVVVQVGQAVTTRAVVMSARNTIDTIKNTTLVFSHTIRYTRARLKTLVVIQRQNTDITDLKSNPSMALMTWMRAWMCYSAICCF